MERNHTYKDVHSVVVDTTNSKYSMLKPVPVDAVKMGKGFWNNFMELNKEKILNYQFEQLEKDGLINSFRKASDPEYKPNHSKFAGDARLYKWIEAVSWVLASGPCKELESLMDECIGLIEAAQSPNGYINTNFPEALKHLRWSNTNQLHEMFAAGHLMQAAIAHHRALGSRRLLDVAVLLADHICETFGPGRKEEACGHPEIEMALVELYRETGDRKYLDMAMFFIDVPGTKHMKQVAGHAVKALFLFCGMTDSYLETGDAEYLEAAERLWHNMTTTNMYVTGAVGGRFIGEAFGREFELPHENGYSETCANISNVLWNWRLLCHKGEQKYADLMELVLYNSVISGVSLDGTKYFYVNPHASGAKEYNDPWKLNGRMDAVTRSPWFACPCCPPHLSRMIASLPGYFYSTSKDGFWVHLYDNNTVEWKLENGTHIKLIQATEYPWNGKVNIKLSVEDGSEFSLYLRIPEWSKNAIVSVDGVNMSALHGEYFEIKRKWSSESEIVLDLNMEPELVVANPMAVETRNSVVVKRGPLVYCFEGKDNLGFSVRNARIKVDRDNPRQSVSFEYLSNLLGGVMIVKARGIVPTEEWGYLYRNLEDEIRKFRDVEIAGIPYYAWDNRGVNEMTVWLLME